MLRFNNNDYTNTVWYRGSHSGHYREFKIDGNEAEELGPGLYYTDSYDLASHYGPVREFSIDVSKGFCFKGSRVDIGIITTIINYADKDHLEVAFSNWDENPRVGREKLIQSIMRNKDMPDAIVALFIDVFRQDREDFFMSCRAAGVHGLVYFDPYDSGRSSSFLVLFTPDKAKFLD